MAVANPTKTGDFSGYIDETMAAPIFERAARIGVVPRLAQRVPLALNGTKIPIVTGRPAAEWVGEGNKKPVNSGSMDLKHIEAHKIASIFVVSEEVARLNPGQFVERMRNSFAETFAVGFDLAALHNLDPAGTGPGPFTTYVGQTGKSVEIGTANTQSGGIYTDLIGAMRELVTDSDSSGRRYRLTGWALDDVMEPALRGAVDNTGSPIWVDLPSNDENSVLANSRLMARPALFGEGVATPNLTDTVGFAGDWSQCAWGQVGGIEYSISRETAVTIGGSLVSLWENNLVAVRAEAWFGFVVADTDAFVALTNTSNAPVTSA